MPKYISQEPCNYDEPLPPGNYFVKVIAAKESQSKTGGNPMIELTLLEKESRNYIYERLVFTEKALYRIDQFRHATGEEILPGKEVELNAEDCINRTCWVALEIETYNSKQKNVVKAWMTEAEMKKPVAPKPKPAEDIAPDDIPF